jgi:DNA processing protein
LTLRPGCGFSQHLAEGFQVKKASQSAAATGGIVGSDGVAACALSCVPGMGAAALARVAQSFGSLASAVEAGPEALAARAGELRLRREAREFLAGNPDLAELGAWALDAARAAGAHLVLRGDDSYPALLGGIENPPAVLYVRGELARDPKRVALVGARAADDRASSLARKLGEELAVAGVQVVSGGARGIDAEAHAGALWGGGTTVAVLGSGIDMPYPQENALLFERLASGSGALVSEFAPGSPSARSNFPRRNRTIAGLSHATVVVRATLESGALITANHAAAQGRAIFAVPGAAADALCAGPNLLLAEGAARAVTCARDILDLLGWLAPDRLSRTDDRDRPVALQPAAPVAAAARREQSLDRPSFELWRLLDERRPLHADELAEQCRVPAHEALRRLTELEVKGLCLQRPGKYFLRR